MNNLDCIRARGTVLLGTTADYFPMSYWDSEEEAYKGKDVELARRIGAALGVKVKFVKTSWPCLETDLLEDKFDIAICGITITPARKEKFLMSDGYRETGKSILCREKDINKFKSLEDVNKPEVRVMYNPGGTNEKFVMENLPHAQKIMHKVNNEIPLLISEGEADVMITETVEAEFYIMINLDLAAPLISEPFTHDEFGVMMNKGNEDLLEIVNSVIPKFLSDTHEFL